MVDANLLADKLSYYYIPGYPSIISLLNPILPLAFHNTALLSGVNVGDGEKDKQ